MYVPCNISNLYNISPENKMTFKIHLSDYPFYISEKPLTFNSHSHTKISLICQTKQNIYSSRC